MTDTIDWAEAARCFDQHIGLLSLVQLLSGISRPLIPDLSLLDAESQAKAVLAEFRLGQLSGEESIDNALRGLLPPVLALVERCRFENSQSEKIAGREFFGIPPFTADGYLPPGIYQASWEVLCDRYSYTQRRRRQLQSLLAVIQLLRRANCSKIYVAGSFVSMKNNPGDIDYAVMPEGMNWEFLDPILQQTEDLGTVASEMRMFFGIDDITHKVRPQFRAFSQYRGCNVVGSPELFQRNGLSEWLL